MGTMMLMTFGLFNVIVAIYVENTTAAAKYDDVAKQRRRLMDEGLMEEKSAALVKVIMQLHNDQRSVDDDGPPVDSIQDALRIEINRQFFEHGLIVDRAFKEILHDL